MEFKPSFQFLLTHVHTTWVNKTGGPSGSKLYFLSLVVILEHYYYYILKTIAVYLELNIVPFGHNIITPFKDQKYLFLGLYSRIQLVYSGQVDFHPDLMIKW